MNNSFTGKQLKDLFISFWRTKDHTIIKNASLIPENDPFALVTVYTIGDYENPISRERCMGPHVTNTSEIKGTFKITKQEKIGANLLRIKGQLI